MGATGNALTASFGLDLTPLKRDFQEAKKIAATEAASVQRTMSEATSGAGRSNVNWNAIAQQRQQAQQFFRQNGPVTGANFRPAPAGKYMSPAQQMAEESATGRLPRGLGTGLSIVTLVHQLANSYAAANEEATKLWETTSKLFAATSSGATESTFTANIKGIGETLDALSMRKKMESSDQSWIAVVKGKLRQLATGDSDGKELALKINLREKAKEQIDELAAKQGELNDVEREGLSGSEERSALMKAELENKNRLGQLAELEAKSGVHNPAAMAAENERFRMEQESIRQRFDIKNREVAVEQELANMTESSATLEEQKTAALQKRAGLIEDELAFNKQITTEQRAQLNLQLTKAKSALLRDEFENRFDGPALSTPAKQAQAIFQSWAKAQRPTGPDAYKTHPDAYARSPDAYGGPNDPVPRGGRPYQRQIQPPSHMADPGHMAPYGGSGEFNDWFGPPKTQRPDYSKAVNEAKAANEAKAQTEKPMTKEDMDNVMNKYWGN